MRQARQLVVLAVVFLLLAAAAQATQSVKLTASLTPERLGHGTTIGFGFQITAPAGSIPAPLTAITVRYPENLGIALSGLGISTCSVKALEVIGPAGCPPDSRMGYGSAVAVMQIGPELVREPASVSVVRAPTADGHISLLFYANGLTPVDAQLVFPGALVEAKPPFGGAIGIDVPLIPSLPEAPDVAVIKLHSTIGPEHLTYYEEVDHRRVAYEPMGILLPDSCPRRGFQFSAALAFADGSSASARAAVPCPKTRARHTPSKG